ncbi:uncharacterized protein PgNI_03222 [Pyricularia grisea]|uniref:Uncharacterized protein n=1 Tax=Pyricularia grisea TaxID=148305 RepID=A0A6P8BBI2_PYRGI|nr:uncharacterized protein PgNI_03222 [Pyricularia grisea]TLD13148.1 hypothetical protein PgNI_03222 [Pyricularia grisea]
MMIVSGNALVRPSGLPLKTWVWSKRTRHKAPSLQHQDGKERNLEADVRALAKRCDAMLLGATTVYGLIVEGRCSTV